MTRTIQSTAGDSRECRLVVRNVTGIAEERGFRLYWQDIAEPNIICPALGLVTSNPFLTAREAIAHGERNFGERAKRVR